MHLNYPVMLKVVGLLTLIEGIAMVPCIITALLYEEWNAGQSLFPLCVICVCVGWVILTQLKFNKILWIFHIPCFLHQLLLLRIEIFCCLFRGTRGVVY